MIGVTAGDRVVFKVAEIACKCDVLSAREVLVAEEQHLVLQQQRSDFGHEVGVTRRGPEVDIAHFCTDGTGEWFYPRGRFQG